MKNIFCVAILALALCACKKIDRSAPVTQEEMQSVYEQVKTPVKHGVVIHPDNPDYLTDSPGVFRHNGKWYMMYIAFDGKGYETYLAESDDLLNWTNKGKILSYRDGAYDACQRAGYPALQDMEWGGSYELEKVDGKYWMTYIAGNSEGYEAGLLSIGMAGTEHPEQAVEWESMDTPVLNPADENRQWFESAKQYKSHIIHDSEKITGHKYVMYYNAAGVNPENGFYAERIGMAFSDDLKTWTRYADNPVLAHEVDHTITGDPQIQKIGDLYVMFHFRAFEPSKPYQAYNTFACSRDLIHWYAWEGEDLIYPTEEYDNLYAHKSWVVQWKGVTYHFYCACDTQGHRGIAVATSK